MWFLNNSAQRCLKARPNDKCWTTQHVGWTNILSFGHRVWRPLNMLDDVGTCLMQYQTFDPTSSNISFVLMLDAWNYVHLAGLNNMLHARTRIRTANSAVTIDTVCSRQCSLKMSASEEAAQNIDQTSSKKTPKQKARRWSDEETDRLIDLLEGNRCLWDVLLCRLPPGRQERTSIFFDGRGTQYIREWY